MKASFNIFHSFKEFVHTVMKYFILLNKIKSHSFSFFKIYVTLPIKVGVYSMNKRKNDAWYLFYAKWLETFLEKSGSNTLLNLSTHKKHSQNDYYFL